jgi:hypothetical protein
MAPGLNMHVNVITGATAAGDLPLPMPVANDWLWSAGYQIQKTWPKRGTREPGASFMKIKPLYDFLEVGRGQCVPWVGFLLTYKGVRKYQMHQRTELQAPCAALRYTDTETWWGKAEIGVTLMRFDYGTAENEKSMRIPVQALWKQARALKIQVVHEAKVPKGVLAHVKKELGVYGGVSVVASKDGGLLRHAHTSSVEVAYAQGYEALAQRLAGVLKGGVASVGAVGVGYDMTVFLWNP